MKRRQVLQATGLTGIALTTGCLGYTVEQESDVQQRQDRIEELESERDNLQAELESIRSERDGLREDLEVTNKENVLNIYELASETRDQGESAISNGTSFFEDENYETASIRYAYAQQAFSDARIMLDEIVDSADGYSQSAGDLINNSKNYCEVATTVSLHLVDGSYYASIDRMEDARSELNEADRISQQLDDYEFHDVRDVRNELNL